MFVVEAPYMYDANDNYSQEITLKLNEVKAEFVKQATLLDSLSPLKTLTRGYSLVEKEGKVISSVEELKQGDKVSLRLQNGTKEAVVE